MSFGAAADWKSAWRRHDTAALAAIVFLAVCGSMIASATEPPARVVINFPFRTPQTASTATFLNWLAELGAPAMRQLTYNDTLWSRVEPVDDAFDYSVPDPVLFNSQGIRPLPMLYSHFAGPNDLNGLQVPWLACTNPPFAPDCGWFADRDAAASENYVTNTVARYRSWRGSGNWATR